MFIYVINLKRNPERLLFVGERFNSLNLPFERIDAVDGVELSNEFIEKFRSDSKRETGWKVGQIGCFLSHFDAWEKIANGESEYGIIFEDDLHISSALADFVNDLSWIPADTDVVRLENATNLIKARKNATVHDRELLTVESDSWCAGGYVLSKKAAQFLISQDKSAYLPADWYIFAKTHSGVANQLSIYQVQPSLACQDKNSDGMIEQDELMRFDSDIEIEKEPKKTFQLQNFKKLIKHRLAPLFGYRRIEFKD